MNGHTFSADELFGEIKEDLKSSIQTDPRMYDFVEGTFVYESPTENLETKMALFNELNSDFSIVTTIVGGTWPLLYSIKGSNIIHSFDISIKQIKSFISILNPEYVHEARFIDQLKSGDATIHLKDLTKIEDPSVQEALKTSTIIDLSNILDYYQPSKASKLILSIYNLISPSSILILSSLRSEKIKFFGNTLLEANIPYISRTPQAEPDGNNIENFLALKK